MKVTFRNSLQALFLGVLLGNSLAHATVLYWDPEGSTAESAANLAGTWSTAAQWSASSAQTASPSAWVSGDAACFCAGSTTVTTSFAVALNSAMNIGGIYNGGLNPPGVFITINGSGSLNLISGADAFDTGGSDGGTTTITLPVTGSGQMALEGSDQIYLNATNTYTGGTFLGFPGVLGFSGTANFNNNKSFGTGPIYMTSVGFGSTLQVEGTTAVTLANSFVATNVSLNIVGNAAGLTFSGPWSLMTTPSINASGSGNLVTISGIISGPGGLNKYGPSTLTLNAANTFTGGIIVSNGTLALGAGGSISNCPSITLVPGANGTVFDVSAIPNYVFDGTTALFARGTGIATTAEAKINGSSTGILNLATNTINLTFTPTIFTGDMGHSALVINPPTRFNNNLITVSNAAGTALGAGLYRLIQDGNGFTGTILGSPNPAVTVLGKGLAAGLAAYLMVSNANLNMIVKPLALFSAFTTTQTNVYGVGAISVTLGGKVSAGTLFPAMGETVGITANGTALSAPVIDTNGDFTVSFNPAAIPYATNGCILNYAYAGDNALSPAALTNTLAPDTLLYGSALPGFFSGMNLILTNVSGVSMSTWSTTNPGLPITDWALEGAMEEVPLTAGYSRYSINVTPATGLVYYISAPSQNWPFLTPAGLQWITTDSDGNYTFYTNNVPINAAGVLDLPLPPTIVVQPAASLTVLAGQTAVLNTTVTGAQPMSYQWYYNTNTPQGSPTTNAPLTLVIVTTNAIGTYSVLVTNLYGSATSSAAILMVLPQPQISTTITTNGFELAATGVPSATYWVQTTTNLNPPASWQTIVTNTADDTGLAQFIDTNGMVNPELFYRLAFP